MDSSLKSISQIAALNTKLFLNALDGIDEEYGKKRLNESTNNISFIALHLLDARFYICRFMGLNIKNPFAEQMKVVKNVDELKDCPSLEEIRTCWKEVSQKLEKVICEISAEDLTAKSGMRLPMNDDSKYGAVSFLLQHESYHIGQIAFLRKSLGFDSMAYS